ncbi:hypothetical protein ACLKA6_001302 [Drosophila palustris]
MEQENSAPKSSTLSEVGYESCDPTFTELFRNVLQQQNENFMELARSLQASGREPQRHLNLTPTYRVLMLCNGVLLRI